MKRIISALLAITLAAFALFTFASCKKDAGYTIAVPNDPTNEARALLLLEANGIIKLKEGVGINATVKDIAENPQNIKFVEIEAANTEGRSSAWWKIPGTGLTPISITAR